MWHRRSSESYINWIRSKGVKVGHSCYVQNTRHIDIDVSRPSLVEIGNHVFLHKNLSLITHDWASWCFVPLYNDFIPSHAKIVIGNNVWFGESCTVLKGVTIGDNCIIGLGSIVTKDIPANSVAIGRPAKVVCSIDEYYQKRKKQYRKELFDYASTLINNSNISKDDFKDDYILFVDASNYRQYDYPYSNVFSSEQFEIWKSTHKKEFIGYEEFIEAVKKERCC